MSPHYRLTSEIEQKIVNFIRAGGFPWVAAEAAGIPRKIFHSWLRLGKRRRAKKLYRRFYQSVIEARAHARLTAELETRKNDPRFWLRHGPGREKPGAPGWTNPIKPIQLRKASQEERFMSPEFMRFLSRLMEILGPYPEPRAAVAKAAEEFASEEKQKKRLKTRCQGGGESAQ
jgi:hypothetical protein